MDREGRSYSGTFDWFYPEVREYKLAIVDELLKYPAKGLLLDFVRHNATASADAAGIHRFGYNPEIRAAFKKAHGVDPLDLPADDERWLAFKREIRTSLVRDVRRRMDATRTCKELSLMTWPVDCARWLCLDVPGLAASGAVQMITAFSLAYSIRPEEARLQMKIMKQQTRGSRVRLVPGLMAYGGIQRAHVDRFVEAAEKAGAPAVMLYEADALVKSGLAPAVRAINFGHPNYKRSLTATRVDDGVAPDRIDWRNLPVFSDFLFHFGPKPEPTPSERTEVQFAWNKSGLILRFGCADRDMKTALAPIEVNPQHQYYIDALRQRGPYYDRNSFSVLLDPSRAGEDAFQFSVTPRQEKFDATFVDEDWDGAWSAEVLPGENGWAGTLRIPFSSLGCADPKPGEAWGCNLLRGIRRLNEIDIWFPVGGAQPCPHELGRLEFLA
jgi:hypothetical protein